MIKFSTKGKELQEVQKGAKKEYFGKLKVLLSSILHFATIYLFRKH